MTLSRLFALSGSSQRLHFANCFARFGCHSHFVTSEFERISDNTDQDRPDPVSFR